jgi:Family of unknown function (DUF6527)
MKAMLRNVHDKDKRYQCLMFVCPGCASDENHYGTGLHMLPVNTTETSPSWNFDGNLDFPTISPSIKTDGMSDGKPFVCHSFLKGGIFQFLEDSTHPLSGKLVPMVDLPDWVLEEV